MTNENMVLYGYVLDDSNKIVKKFITPFLKNIVLDLDVHISGIDENGNAYIDIPEGDICTWHILEKWLVPIYKVKGEIIND